MESLLGNVEADVQQPLHGPHTPAGMPYPGASSPLALTPPPTPPPSHEEDTDLAVSEVIESLIGNVEEQVASMKGVQQEVSLIALSADFPPCWCKLLLSFW